MYRDKGKDAFIGSKEFVLGLHMIGLMTQTKDKLFHQLT